MPISGLVVSLAKEPPKRRETIDAIAAEPRIEVGVIESNRMAIVLDTADREEDRELWSWLSALPGVVFIDVAMVAFDDGQTGDADRRCQPRCCEQRTQNGF